MDRKYLSIGILILLVAGITTGYFLIQFKAGKGINDPWEAIPGNAAIVAVINNAGDIADTNGPGKELSSSSAGTFLQLLNTGNDSKSMGELVNKVLTLLDLPFFVSFHSIGINDYGDLFLARLKSGVTEGSVLSLIRSGLPKDGELAERKVSGVSVYDYSTHDHQQSISYALYGHLLFCSRSSLLLEDALQRLQQVHHLPDANELMQVKRTAGRNNLNIFIHFRNFSEYLTRLVNKESIPLVKSLGDFSSWSELDLFKSPGITMLSGFSASGDSLLSYQKILVNQQPQGFDILRAMPGNTAAFCIIGLGDPKEYLQGFESHVLNKEQRMARRQILKRLDTEQNCTLDSAIVSFCGNQLAICVTSDTIYGKEGRVFELMMVRDAALAESFFAQLGNKPGGGKDKSLVKTVRAEDGTPFRIYKMAIPFLNKILFGQVFGISENKYFTLVGDVMVFGNSVEALASMVNDYVLQRTLFYEVAYNDFADNLDSTANLYLYYKPQNGISLPQNIWPHFNTPVASGLGPGNRVNGFGLQLRRNNGMLFANFVMTSPVQKSEEGIQLGWKVLLDSSLESKPWIVQNYSTGRNEIIAQDIGHKIYLISNGGRIQWKYQMSDQILGDVSQVDFFKNGKLQMLMVTKDGLLHLVDRTGAEVEPFPVKLPFIPVTAPLVTDLDNNRDYRIYIGGNDQKIWCLDKKGKLVKGWNSRKLKGSINAIQVFRSGKLDYITVNTSGGLVVMNRKGEDRIRFGESLKLANNPLYLMKNSRGDRLTGLSEDGRIFNLGLNGIVEWPVLPKKYPDAAFFYTEQGPDRQKSFIVADKDSVFIYDLKGGNLAQHAEEPGYPIPYGLETLPGGKVCLPLFSPDSSRFGLVDLYGKWLAGMPVEAGSPGTITVLNTGQGKFNLLLGGKFNFLYNFIMQ